MKKRRKISSSRKDKGSIFYGLEVAILCVLLMAAVYVGTTGMPGSVKTPEMQKKEAPIKAEKSKEGAKAQKNTAPNAAPALRTCRLSRSIDGDSFELKDEKNRIIRVRLYGVDAPESRQKFGKESKEHLRRLMTGKDIHIKTMYEDSYGRVVAMVYLKDGKGIDERSVNQRQIQAGMAWVYDYFCTEGFCNTWKIEEALAQEQRIGLWRDANPTPPWQWRRENARR